MFTFGENQTDVNNLISSNAQTSQEYNYDYNYNVQNAWVMNVIRLKILFNLFIIFEKNIDLNNYII